MPQWRKIPNTFATHDHPKTCLEFVQLHFTTCWCVKKLLHEYTLIRCCILWFLIWIYSEVLFQWQSLFPKTLPLKWISCCTEYLYLMSKLICKKGLILFLFPHRTNVLDICDLTEAILTNIQNICFFKLFNTIFWHNLWLIATS